MPKISAFVVSYNRADVLGTCLRALRFADELIVVDKSSTDGSDTLARSHADHVLTVPWTPTVEETRALALSLCRHEWVLFMDDDEVLSVESAAEIRGAIGSADHDIYAFPLRHYILGQHDERAYYWPEHHVLLFRRGTVTFTSRVHAGLVHSGRIAHFASAAGVCIHHLSNASVAGWVEKTNRYTAKLDRAGIKAGPEGLAAFAHQRIDHWMAQSEVVSSNDYPTAVALLRAVYDLVDGLKSWETEQGRDGAVLLRDACGRLDTLYSGRPAFTRPTGNDGAESTLK